MRFFIEGNINPWVLLANGDLKEVTQKELKTLTKENKSFRVGDGFKYIDDAGKEVEGVVVGSNAKPSTYVKQLEDIKTTKGAEGLKNEYSTLKQELEAGGDLDKIIYNRQSTYELRKGLGKIPKDFQAHHVIPRELKDKFKDFFTRIKFNIEDGAINGIGVPPNKAVLEASKEADEFAEYAFHQGSHPNYTDRIKLKIEKIELDLNMNKINDKEALTKIIELTDKAKAAIKIGKGKTMNDIIF